MASEALGLLPGGNAENAGALFGRLTRAVHGARPSGQLRCSQALQAPAVGTFSRQREKG